jgi:7-cyano-7-deazaguanine synthase in queuosine biosynthesis
MHKNVQDGDNCMLIHIDYGQKAALMERKAAMHFANKYNFGAYYTSMDLSFSKASIMKNVDMGLTQDQNRLELRNLLFLSYAASYAASTYTGSSIYVGFHKEPLESTFLDAKSEYLKNLNTAIDLACDQKINFKAPFQLLSRKEILKTAMDFDPEIIWHSYTCYEEIECGKCIHCKQKDLMLKEIQEEILQEKR